MSGGQISDGDWVTIPKIVTQYPPPAKSYLARVVGFRRDGSPYVTLNMPLSLISSESLLKTWNELHKNEEHDAIGLAEFEEALRLGNTKLRVLHHVRNQQGFENLDGDDLQNAASVITSRVIFIHHGQVPPALFDALTDVMKTNSDSSSSEDGKEQGTAAERGRECGGGGSGQLRRGPNVNAWTPTITSCTVRCVAGSDQPNVSNSVEPLIGESQGGTLSQSLLVPPVMVVSEVGKNPPESAGPSGTVSQCVLVPPVVVVSERLQGATVPHSDGVLNPVVVESSGPKTVQPLPEESTDSSDQDEGTDIKRKSDAALPKSPISRRLTQSESAMDEDRAATIAQNDTQDDSDDIERDPSYDLEADKRASRARRRPGNRSPALTLKAIEPTTPNAAATNDDVATTPIGAHTPSIATTPSTPAAPTGTQYSDQYCLETTAVTESHGETTLSEQLKYRARIRADVDHSKMCPFVTPNQPCPIIDEEGIDPRNFPTSAYNYFFSNDQSHDLSVYVGDQRFPGFTRLSYAKAQVHGKGSVQELEFKGSFTEFLKIIHSDLSDQMTNDPGFAYSMKGGPDRARVANSIWLSYPWLVTPGYERGQFATYNTLLPYDVLAARGKNKSGYLDRFLYNLNRSKPSIRGQYNVARGSSISRTEKAAIRSKAELDLSYRQLCGDVNFTTAMKKLGEFTTTESTHNAHLMTGVYCQLNERDKFLQYTLTKRYIKHLRLKVAAHATNAEEVVRENSAFFFNQQVVDSEWEFNRVKVTSMKPIDVQFNRPDAFEFYFVRHISYVLRYWMLKENKEHLGHANLIAEICLRLAGEFDQLLTLTELSNVLSLNDWLLIGLRQSIMFASRTGVSLGHTPGDINDVLGLVLCYSKPDPKEIQVAISAKAMTNLDMYNKAPYIVACTSDGTLNGSSSGDFYLAISDRYLAKVEGNLPRVVRCLYMCYTALNVHFPPQLHAFLTLLGMLLGSPCIDSRAMIVPAPPAFMNLVRVLSEVTENQANLPVDQRFRSKKEMEYLRSMCVHFQAHSIYKCPSELLEPGVHKLSGQRLVRRAVRSQEGNDDDDDADDRFSGTMEEYHEYRMKVPSLTAHEIGSIFLPWAPSPKTPTAKLPRLRTPKQKSSAKKKRAGKRTIDKRSPQTKSSSKRRVLGQLTNNTAASASHVPDESPSHESSDTDS